jgi:hypothetical protein
MTAFAVAVGGTSLVCYLLMTCLPNRRANRSAPRDGFLPDGGDYTAAEGWIISSFGPVRDRFRFIPVCIGISLESLQKGPFLFASVHHFQYR